MCETKANRSSARLSILLLLLGLTGPLFFVGCENPSHATYGSATYQYGSTTVAPVAEQYPATYYGSRNVYVAPARYPYYRAGVPYYGRPAVRAATRASVRASYR